MPTNELAIPFSGPGEILAAAIILPLIGSIVVALRFWMRRIQKKGPGADDYTILLALVFLIGMGISLIVGVAKHSVGYPTPQTVANPSAESELFDISPAQTTVELVDWIIWLLMIPTNGLIKISAIFFYRRIFVICKWTTFDIISKILLVICFLWTIAFLFAVVFGCGKHWDYPWKPLYYIGTCETNMRLDGLMVSDLLTDAFVWLLPIIPVWRLHITKTQKLAVIGIFMLAAVSLAAAIVRLLVQFEISNGGYAAHTDVDLTLSMLLYWSMIESGLALIAACLPTLRYLVTHTSVRSFISTARSVIKLDSEGSQNLSSTAGSKNSDYHEISIATKISQSSMKSTESEIRSEISLVPLHPSQAHTKNSWNGIHSDAYA